MVLQLTDEQGKQNLLVRIHKMSKIPGKMILESRPEGDYKVKMIGQTKSGKIVEKETTAHVVLWTPKKKWRKVRGIVSSTNLIPQKQNV
jgi:hypothetical protein